MEKGFWYSQVFNTLMSQYFRRRPFSRKGRGQRMVNYRLFPPFGVDEERSGCCDCCEWKIVAGRMLWASSRVHGRWIIHSATSPIPQPNSLNHHISDIQTRFYLGRCGKQFQAFFRVNDRIFYSKVTERIRIPRCKRRGRCSWTVFWNALDQNQHPGSKMALIHCRNLQRWSMANLKVWAVSSEDLCILALSCSHRQELKYKLTLAESRSLHSEAFAKFH